jgi:hypothetical protein
MEAGDGDLFSLVSNRGLQSVVDGLIEVCEDKVVQAGDDKELAEMWKRASKTLKSVVNKLPF